MYIKALVILLASLQFASCKTYDKVDVTLVYEALCPYTLEFIDQQFYPGYKQLSKYINLELLPIVYIDRSGITCARGEEECMISEAQACVFQRNRISDALKMDYFYCTENPGINGNTTNKADIKACVNSVLKDVLSYETVEACMANDASIITLKKNRGLAMIFRVDAVPSIGLFRVFDKAQEEEIRLNFVKSICDKLSNPPEDICKAKLNL